MVHRQQHETISLKQEKQYIHDINQMKRLREQLSSKRASQEKIEEAHSQRDEVEVQLKVIFIHSLKLMSLLYWIQPNVLVFITFLQVEFEERIRYTKSCSVIS